MTTKTKTAKKVEPLLKEQNFRTFLGSDENNLETVSYSITAVIPSENYMSADLRISNGYGSSVSVGADLYFQESDSTEEIDCQVEEAEERLDMLLYTVEAFVRNAKAAMHTLAVAHKTRYNK